MLPQAIRVCVAVLGLLGHGARGVSTLLEPHSTSVQLSQAPSRNLATLNRAEAEGACQPRKASCRMGCRSWTRQVCFELKRLQGHIFAVQSEPPRIDMPVKSESMAGGRGTRRVAASVSGCFCVLNVARLLLPAPTGLDKRTSEPHFPCVRFADRACSMLPYSDARQFQPLEILALRPCRSSLAADRLQLLGSRPLVCETPGAQQFQLEP